MINIFDLHNDFLTSKMSIKQKQSYINRSKKQGVNNILSAVWTTKMRGRQIFDELYQAKEFCKNYLLDLAIEDLYFVTPNNIDKIIELKPKYAGLTWNYENRLAGGSNSYSGISQSGEDVIRKLEQNNIQIDTAHLNEKSFMRFANITNRPILCSHTAFYSLNKHYRNLKDYQLKIICESGGLVGLCFVKDFLSEHKKVTVSDIAHHIDYFVCKFSIDCISLGTDFYGTDNYPKGINGYKSIIKLQNSLEQLGYTPSSIEKLFYKNAQRFFG